MSAITGNVLIIDTSGAALAEITALRQAATPRQLRKAAPWPSTIVLALPDGGERRIFTLPPGSHVPLTNMAPGILIRSCAAYEALDGCATTDRSDRSVAPAPRFVLDRFALAADAPKKPGGTDPPADTPDALTTPENVASGPPGGTTPDHEIIPDTTELASSDMTTSNVKRFPEKGRGAVTPSVADNDDYADLLGEIDSPSVAPADAKPDTAADEPPDWDNLTRKPDPTPGARFSRWGANGFGQLLLPAGHPGWKPTAGSDVNPDQVAKTPMQYCGAAAAHGYPKWTKRVPACDSDLRRWQRAGDDVGALANVCLRTGRVEGAPLAIGAVDVDVGNAGLVAKIAGLAALHFGASPPRTRSNSSRTLFLYRLAPDVPGDKVRCEFDREDLVEVKDGKPVYPAVEILLTGQQCLVEGLHASGVPYQWPDGYPVAAELPEIDKSALEGFDAALSALLQNEGCTLRTRSESKDRSRQRNDKTPCSRVNKRALRLLDEWVPDVFPEARKQPHGGYRVSSEALGQPEYQEALGLHPVDGIRDFGSEQSFVPTYLLSTFCTLGEDGTPKVAERDADGQRLNTMSVKQAEEWLADQLDIDLAKLYREYGPKGFVAADTDEADSDKSESVPPTDFWRDDAGDTSELPAGVVPTLIEGAARDHALRLGVETGGAAAAIITAMGSLVHAGNRLQMRQNDTGWTVRPILWTAIIAKSGVNKTATLSYALDAARSVDGSLKREYALALRKFNEQRQAAKRKRKGELETQSYEGPATTEILFEPEKPRFRQKIIRDATTEAIAAILADNPGGVLSFRDELSGFFGAMDAYRAKGGVDRPFWLEAKDGGEFTVNRRTSDPIFVENNAVSVLGAIQPDRFRKVCESGALTDDGLLQRFMPIFLNGTGLGKDIAPDQRLADALVEIAATLLEDNEPRRYRFASEADQELSAYQAFVARETDRADTLPAFQQWLAKSVNEFGRLALVFHFLEWHSSDDGMLFGGPPPELLSAATARRARRYLTEFIYPHATKFYRQVLGSSPLEEHVRWIAGYILAHKMSTIANRNIQQDYSRLKKPESRGALASAMQHLRDHGWIKPIHGQFSHNAKSWTVIDAVHVEFVGRAQRERDRREAEREKIRRDVEARRAEKENKAGQGDTMTN